KNSAIEKAEGKWILSLDADEELEPALAAEIKLLFRQFPTDADLKTRIERVQSLTYLSTRRTMKDMRTKMKQHGDPDSFFIALTGYWIARKNFFLGRWIRYGGFWPDRKLRLFQKGVALFEDRAVHEDAILSDGITGTLKNALLHHSYPTLSDYIEHMNRYSSLGAEMVVAKANGKVRFSVVNIVLRPLATFVYNYFFRLGFLDGREGLLLHLYHAVYVSWKYGKVWELSRKQP
ncbi:MAG: glycosyltransferase family 2 protein, partial [Candidatus Sulfotelmatobacter sp.]